MAFREYEDQAELKKLQEVTSLVLREFVRVCDLLDIKYVVWAGTAIGVVRHKGFIPWDDDVDVALLRDDYERFLREAPEVLGDAFRIDNARTQEKYPSPFSYLVARGTINVPDFFETCEWKRSIGIDIFPLDKVSSDNGVRGRQLRGTWFWGRLGFLSATPKPYLPFDGPKRTLVHGVCGIAHWALKVLHVSPRWIQERYERCALLAHDEDADLYADFSDRHPLDWSATADELFPSEPGVFGSFDVMLPRKWDQLLTREYGTYMELPPVEKRKNHYPVELDFGDF